jgi:molybdopterin-guanine dinucleotide biosynthesis protein A
VARPLSALRSGIILAGGRSSRIGEPKALLELAGRPLLRHVASAVAPFCDELIVVAAPEGAQSAELRSGLAREVRALARRCALRAPSGASPLRPRARLVHDQQAHLGPVSGLATGLAAARGALAFVAACDVPFLATDLVAALFARGDANPEADVVLPRWNGYLEPLVGVYRVATMAALYRRQLAEDDLRPTSRLATVRLEVFPESDVLRVDPGGRSFVNVNERADYMAARALVEGAIAPGSRPGRSRRGSTAGG